MIITKYLRSMGENFVLRKLFFYAELLETSCTLVAGTKVISDYDKEAG